MAAILVMMMMMVSKLLMMMMMMTIIKMESGCLTFTGDTKGDVMTDFHTFSEQTNNEELRICG